MQWRHSFLNWTSRTRLLAAVFSVVEFRPAHARSSASALMTVSSLGGTGSMPDLVSTYSTADLSAIAARAPIRVP